MAATLTKAMLNDLHRGVAAISLLPYGSSGVTSFANLDFSAADQIFTLKDSFTISQGDPSVEEIKIDQGDVTIDSDTTQGEWSIAGNIPSVASAVLAYFYESANAMASVTVKGQGSGTANYTRGAAFFSTPKEVQATMLIESASKKTAIVLANVKMTVGLSKDDATNPAYLKLAGTILTNTESTGKVGDFAVLYAE